MTLIKSVLGFNMDVNLKDNEGNLLKIGARIIIPANVEAPNVGTKIGGQSWFTNYNEQLLTKIRDYRRIND